MWEWNQVRLWVKILNFGTNWRSYYYYFLKFTNSARTCHYVCYKKHVKVGFILLDLNGIYNLWQLRICNWNHFYNVVTIYAIVVYIYLEIILWSTKSYHMKSNTMLTSIITCKPHLLFRCIKYEKLYNKTVYQFFYD